MINHLQNLLPGPAEGTAEHKALHNECKFSYHQILGELIYTYIVARVDIGYAVTLLSQFSQAPAKEHYAALRHVCKYLCWLRVFYSRVLCIKIDFQIDLH